MSALNGIFSLRTPHDLRKKLESDFLRLSATDPSTLEAQYAAFDFFVCAEHLADWQAKATGISKTSCRKYPDGALVSHIASGAKHFSTTDPKHQTVSDTKTLSTGFQPNAFQSNAFQYSTSLVIKLENGRVEGVISIAKRVLEHWRSVLP